MISQNIHPGKDIHRLSDDQVLDAGQAGTDVNMAPRQQDGLEEEAGLNSSKEFQSPLEGEASLSVYLQAVYYF